MQAWVKETDLFPLFFSMHCPSQRMGNCNTRLTLIVGRGRHKSMTSQSKSKYCIYLSLLSCNGPDYFDEMGGGCWGVMVIGSFKIAYYCYIFAHYHPTNIIWNVAKNSGLRYMYFANPNLDLRSPLIVGY